ncbi:hypothetical protein [Methanohalophilus sp.]|uniref:hypothetical protein n=1 Tax=Methanohalophilus sp. TaxID=1966352 RepID=UPI002623743D|nr:hypothetical protein [Methanohalophilus sp.]MDK2892966.1 hypothetical protein [Methanohalophilus sp.]
MEETEPLEKTVPASQSLSSFEMGRDDVNVVCSYGKISIWFGRQTPEVVVGKVLIGISSVDRTAVHEMDIVCPFEKITEYESYGYTLVSYAKCSQGYRATFQISFNNNKALFHLAEHILQKLKTSDMNMDVYWTGDDSDITKLSEQLKDINGWNIKEINYKENSGKDK